MYGLCSASKTVSGSTTTYNWDFENRLTSVVLPGMGGTVTFKYDPFGRRIEKISPTAGTMIYAYDGDNVVEQLNSSGTATARYTQGLGIDEPMEVYEGGKSYYYHADGLGSIVALTKSTGTTANTYFGYNTFGGIPNPSETVSNPFRFTARDYDSETGFYYYRARYYDSLFGRFLSEDAVRFNAGIDFYTYGFNDPVNLVDPRGLAACCPARDEDAIRKRIQTVRSFVDQLETTGIIAITGGLRSRWLRHFVRALRLSATGTSRQRPPHRRFGLIHRSS